MNYRKFPKKLLGSQWLWLLHNACKSPQNHDWLPWLRLQPWPLFKNMFPWHLGDIMYDESVLNHMTSRWYHVWIKNLYYQHLIMKYAYQSKPSKSPSPLMAQVLKMAHWRFFILCNSKASVTAASSSEPGRSYSYKAMISTCYKNLRQMAAIFFQPHEEINLNTFALRLRW